MGWTFPPVCADFNEDTDILQAQTTMKTTIQVDKAKVARLMEEYPSLRVEDEAALGRLKALMEGKAVPADAPSSSASSSATASASKVCVCVCVCLNEGRQGPGIDGRWEMKRLTCDARCAVTRDPCWHQPPVRTRNGRSRKAPARATTKAAPSKADSTAAAATAAPASEEPAPSVSAGAMCLVEGCQGRANGKVR